MKHPMLIDIPTRIETPRLVLRHPKAGDGDMIYEMLQDGYEDYVTWLNWPAQIPNQDDIEREARLHHARWILREDMRFLMIDKKTGGLLGRLGIPSAISAWDVPMFGISYICRKSSRGNGYTTEAAHALTKLAFSYMGAKKVQIICDVLNQKSINVPKRLGFIHESTNKGIFTSTQGVGEFYTYACFDPEVLPPLDIRFVE